MEPSIESENAKSILVSLKENLRMFIMALSCIRYLDANIMIETLQKYDQRLRSIIEIKRLTDDEEKLLQEIHSLSRICSLAVIEREKFDKSV